MTREHRRWKLSARPFPVAVGAIAVDGDDRPVGHLAGVAGRLMLGGRERTVMAAVDGMTAPECRGQGIYSALSRWLWEQWRSADVALVLGLPNDLSRKPALGWRTLFPLRWLVRPLRPERMLARRAGGGLVAGVVARTPLIARTWNALWAASGDPARTRLREIEHAGGELDEVAQRIARPDLIAAVHDGAWVEWRYHAAPHRRYRVLLGERASGPVGYAAFSVESSARSRGVVLAEVYAAPEDSDARRALIRGVVREGLARDADAIFALAIPGTRADADLRAEGFILRRGAFNVECTPLDPGLRLEDLRSPARWLLAGADFDVV